MSWGHRVSSNPRQETPSSSYTTYLQLRTMCTLPATHTKHYLLPLWHQLLLPKNHIWNHGFYKRLEIRESSKPREGLLLSSVVTPILSRPESTLIPHSQTNTEEGRRERGSKTEHQAPVNCFTTWLVGSNKDPNTHSKKVRPNVYTVEHYQWLTPDA